MKQNITILLLLTKLTNS